MQTGIVRTADGLLLPGFGPLAMFKMLVEAALSPFMLVAAASPASCQPRSRSAAPVKEVSCGCRMESGTHERNARVKGCERPLPLLQITTPRLRKTDVI